MMIEQNIEVDEDDNRIGLRPRDDFYTGKYIHRASHLLLFNSEGKVLLQKRSSSKRWYPDLYTYSVSGTVADESYEDCLAKEMEEEIGISVDAKMIFKYPFYDEFDKAYHAVFIATSDRDITPDTGEIQEIRWVALDELKKDLEAHPERYTPPFREGMKRYFAEHREGV